MAGGRRALVRMLPALLVVVAAIGGLWWQVRAGLPPPAAMPCARAGLVDGRLRCDDELPPDAAALCPGVEGAGAVPIVTGDAVDTAQLCARGAGHGGAAGRSRMAPQQLAALGVPVDLNHASEQELTSLPRIGPTLARRIVAGRPYAQVEGLLAVRGIGPATMAVLRPRVVVDFRPRSSP